MLLDQVPGWSVGAQLVVAGVAVTVIVDRLQRAWRAGHDRAAPWLAWMSFVLAAGLTANVWVLSAPSNRVDQVAFVRSVLLIATALTLVPLAARLAGARVPRVAMGLLAGVGAVRLVLWPISDAVSAHHVAASGALRYGSLVAVTTVPAVLLVLAGLVSVWTQWGDRIERATFVTGVTAALALLVSSLVAGPALGELLTGWGLVPLVIAMVAIVVRRHRHRDVQFDRLEVVSSAAHEQVGRLAARSEVALEAADAAWWEFQPSSNRFVASDEAWALLEAAGADPAELRRGGRTASASVSLDSVLQALRPDARLEARHALHLLAEGSGPSAHLDARVPLRGVSGQWLDVRAAVAHTDPSWVVGTARDATADQRRQHLAGAQRRRGMHVGPDAVQRLGALTDHWLANGRTVHVHVVEVSGLDGIAVALGEGADVRALDEMLRRVAWSRPAGAHVAALTDRHLVVVTPTSSTERDEADTLIDSRSTDAGSTASSVSSAATTAERIHDLFDRPVEVVGQLVQLSAAIGIAVGPADGDGFGVLVARARGVAAAAGIAPATARFVPDDVDAAVVAMHAKAHVAWLLRTIGVEGVQHSALSHPAGLRSRS